MKLNTIFSASVLSLAVATASTAMAEVSVTAFSSGQAATADSVNQNFTAVANGVNANEAAIAALVARIEALEAAQPAATYEERIAGSTYLLSWTYDAYFGQDNLAGSMTNYIRFLMGGGSSTITLNADGSILEQNASESEVEGSTYLSVSGDVNYNNNMQTNSDSWQDSGTWSVDESTGVVTITWEFDEGGQTVYEDDAFQSSEDGSLFVRQGSMSDVDGDQIMVENHNVYWVRIPTPQP